MADIDISNTNIPHDGRFKYQGSVGEINLRASTFPTHLGETVVLRLLKYTDVVGDLSRHGFEKDDLERFMQNLKRPYGLVLSTGPTGSGKSTTLAGLIDLVRTLRANQWVAGGERLSAPELQAAAGEVPNLISPPPPSAAEVMA